MPLINHVFLRWVGRAPQNEKVLGYSGELSEEIIYLIFMWTMGSYPYNGNHLIRKDDIKIFPDFNQSSQWHESDMT